MYQIEHHYIKYKKALTVPFYCDTFILSNLLLSEPAGLEPAIRILSASYVLTIKLKTVKFYEHSET